MTTLEYLNSKEDKRDIAQKIKDIKKLITDTSNMIIDQLENELHFEAIDELILTRTMHGDSGLSLEVNSDRISSLSACTGSLVIRYVNILNNSVLDVLPMPEIFKIAECVADHYNEAGLKTDIEKSSANSYLVTLDWSELDAESKES